MSNNEIQISDQCHSAKPISGIEMIALLAV